MKTKSYFLAIIICWNITVYAQNTPLILWGTGLDGTVYQSAAIYADLQNGLLFEAPFNPAGEKLPIRLSWRGGGVPGLTILPNGNVGIGRSDPQAKLDILGGVNSYLVSTGQVDATTSTKNIVNFSSNNHGTVLVSSNLFMSTDDNLKIANTHSSLSGAGIVMPGNQRLYQGSILFYTNHSKPVISGDLFTEGASMIIKDNGDVGIGTLDTKGFKLAIGGNTVAESVTVKLKADWPDYVFSEKYQLPTLKETEAYININKHLSGIPSKDEVAKGGINLGELNAKLLQKIEELTLHMIALEKKNEQQQKQINDLESKK
jgi:hypothetical protein